MCIRDSLGGSVGQDVVGELLDLEGPAVLLELLFDRAVQDFGVGGGGGGYGDLLVIGGGLVLAAAGQGQRSSCKADGCQAGGEGAAGEGCVRHG